MAARSVIVLGDDGWETSSMARVAAIDLARRTNATLILTHAIEHADETGPRARRELHELMTEGCDGIDARVHITTGDAVDVLLETARSHGATLVVTGHHHRGRVGHWIFGSVAEGLVESGEVPLLVVPEGSHWPPRRFIVGEDGSDAARLAGDLAARLATLVEAEVRLVETLPRSDLFGDLDAEHHVVEAGRHLRGRAVELSHTSHQPTRVEVHFAAAVDMLERLAERTKVPTCIVVGRRSRTAGSPLPPHVSDTLLRHSGHCLLIHPAPVPAASAGAGRA